MRKNWEKKRHCVVAESKGSKAGCHFVPTGRAQFSLGGKWSTGGGKKKKNVWKNKMEDQIQPEQLVASCITQVLMDKGNLEIENHHYYRMFNIVFIFILMLFILKSLPARWTCREQSPQEEARSPRTCRSTTPQLIKSKQLTININIQPISQSNI